MTCLFVAFLAGDQLGLLLVVGITALVFTHIFQNMGMTIAMLPITGVPLPLISYSGSFVLMIMWPRTREQRLDPPKNPGVTARAKLEIRIPKSETRTKKSKKHGNDRSGIRVPRLRIIAVFF